MGGPSQSSRIVGMRSVEHAAWRNSRFQRDRHTARTALWWQRKLDAATGISPH
jgi:hypothetical protein